MRTFIGLSIIGIGADLQTTYHWIMPNPSIPIWYFIIALLICVVQDIKEVIK